VITIENLKLKISNLDTEKANNIADQINLIAASYKIDSSELLKLLDEDPKELEKGIEKLEAERDQLKYKVRAKILE